jgi:hypothetical protein
MPRLPKRLECLGFWIGNVSSQPAAVWWAARQKSIHPGYRERIKWTLFTQHAEFDGKLVAVWKHILEAWSSSSDSDSDFGNEWENLKRDLKSSGWSLAAVRRLVNLTAPYLKVSPGLSSRPAPPEIGEEYRIFDLVRIEVECPIAPSDAAIPDEWLHHVVRGLRVTLKASARLCEEVNDYQRLHISPIMKDDRTGVGTVDRTRGLSGCVISFASLFDRLFELDLQRAREEFAAWPSDDETVFARLRFWASG